MPLGVLAAVYLNEYGKNSRLAGLIRFLANVMTGVPSIVMGLFIYTVWVLRFKQSGFAGALALACLMLPIVIRASEEILALVPAELREATMALGARSWRTVVHGGAAGGDARPHQRFAARHRPGRGRDRSAAVHARRHPDRQHEHVLGHQHRPVGRDLPQHPAPFDGAHERAYGAAFTLVAIVFILSIAARLVSSRLGLRPTITRS